MAIQGPGGCRRSRDSKSRFCESSQALQNHRKEEYTHVKIVSVRRELSSQSIDLLDPWLNTKALPACADLVFSAVDSLGDLLVRETELLGLEDNLLLESEQAAYLLKLMCEVDDVLKLVQEPLVNLSKVMDPVDSVTFVEQRLTNGKPSAIGGVLEFLVKVLSILLALETKVLGVDLTASLLE